MLIVCQILLEDRVRPGRERRGGSRRSQQPPRQGTASPTPHQIKKPAR